MPPVAHRLVTVTAAGAVLLAGGTVPALAATPATTQNTTGTVAAAAAAKPTTSAQERRRVDRVRTPKLAWYSCYGYAQCATVRLPLDYDNPKGATTEVAVLRVKARDPKKRIGSLFVNPGGPGGSSTEMAYFAPEFLHPAVLDRFDVVGVDPRGVAFSDNLKCFRSTRDQTLATRGLHVAFPFTKKEEAAYISSARAVGKGCSTTGRTLAGAMSTAEVVRDMEVMRRAVGDAKLSFLGFSYGSAVGQYYANMFPDRFRAIAIDGVLNPVAWTGVGAGHRVLDSRLRSADGANRALREILKRCDQAGTKYCEFAAGDASKRFALIGQKLRAKPLVINEGGYVYTLTYADFVGSILGGLYGTYAGESVTSMAQSVWNALGLSGSAAVAPAKAKLAEHIRTARAQQRRSTAWDFPYDNSTEATNGVICTDGLHPRDAASWPGQAAAADKRAPYFGRLWGWIDAPCARNTWTVRDEDAYLGPFNRRTAAPVLVVGNRWDPATNYDSAVAAARMLPNSRLLSSNNWGHTAYGTSTCATDAIAAYLVSVRLPAKGKVCAGRQPFTEPLETMAASDLRTPTATEDGRAPVATPLPRSVLNGNR